MKVTLIVTMLAFGAASVPQDPGQPIATEQHVWLKQLVGEWNATAEVITAPGAEPMMLQSTESVRLLGGLWIVAESSASFFDTDFKSILTIGYDPQKKAFVGTWIDTVQTNMWHYTGSLDEARRVLTLVTEGPGVTDPTQTAKYRETIEIKSPDHKVFTSSVQNEDGTWMTFVTANYHRKEPAEAVTPGR